jgi:hypothetical protein
MQQCQMIIAPRTRIADREWSPFRAKVTPQAECILRITTQISRLAPIFG